MTSKLWAASVALGLGGIQLANAASVGAGCLNLAYPGTGGQPSYLDANVTFSSGTLPSGVYDAFCANINRAVGPQVYSFTAWEISAPEVASLGMVFDAANLDQVEFILNQAYPGQLSPDLTAFTSDDVQVAIWSLLDGPASLSLNRSALNFTQDRVDFILNEAGANGVGFVAGCGQIKAYILNPVALGCAPVENPSTALPMFQNLIIGRVNLCTDPIEDPVTLQCGGVSVGQVGTAFSTTLVAGGGVPPYSFSITDGALPEGLELDGNTGEISGIPTAGGGFSFTAKVVDSVGTTGIYTASIDCGIGITPNLLEVGCVANVVGQVGQPYSAALTASGGIAPYTFAIGGGALPDGLELDPQTGVISGQPLVAGNFNFTVSVADQVGTGYSQTVSAECSIVVEPPCVPLALQCASTAVGTVGSAYSAAFPVEGGVAPFTFSVESGMLPPGLELNLATGHLEGIPTSAGVFNFSVSVVDSSGSACGGNQSASVSCGITVESECPPIALGCVSVATGKVGTAYVSGLSVAGGIAPYTYSIISGNLPTGLSLNPVTGAITGTPTVAGTFQFTAKVRSASSGGTPPSGAAQTVTVGSSYGCNSRVSVTFYGCSSTVDVSSTKDLSNVVLQTCDGTRYKFDGLSSRTGRFTSPNGLNIVRVYVKSGCYQCGDGPGFGWRVDGPCASGNCDSVPPTGNCGYDSSATVSCSITISSASVCNPVVTCGDTKPHEYWSSYQGQCYLKSLGDGPNCRKLSNWLACKYPYLWGRYSGSKNLSGKCNREIADVCRKLSSQYGSKTEAHMLACALSCYVTDTRNCGTSGNSQNLNVSCGGTGAKKHNVGWYGSGGGLCNGREYSVSSILDQANNCKKRGCFNSNSFGTLFNDINCKGSRR